MTKNYSKVIPIDLYKRGLLIFIGDKNECVKLLKRDKISEESVKQVKEFDMTGTTAVTFCIDGDVLIYMENKKPIEVLVHELSHVAFMVLRIVGIDPTQSEEAYAYLLGYLYEKAALWFNDVPCDVQ